MSILEELNGVVTGIGLKVETGKFSERAPREYIVLTPIIDVFDLFADDVPEYDISEVRISLFSKGNYIQRVKQLVKALFSAGFTITERRYIGHDDDTGYFNYAIDSAKNYITDLEEE